MKRIPTIIIVVILTFLFISAYNRANGAASSLDKAPEPIPTRITGFVVYNDGRFMAIETTNGKMTAILTAHPRCAVNDGYPRCTKKK